MTPLKNRQHDPNGTFKPFKAFGTGMMLQELRTAGAAKRTAPAVKPESQPALQIAPQNGRTILLIEDDSVDVMTVKRAFKELKITNPLVVVENGGDALDYLEKQKTPPFLVLLDLNMPRMNGVEFLQVFKRNRAYIDVHVVVLTTSRGDQDRTDCGKLGVSGYFVKPVEYSEFCETLKVIYRYWTLNQAPI